MSSRVCLSCGNKTTYLNDPTGLFNCSLSGTCTTPCQFTCRRDKRGRPIFECIQSRVYGMQFCLQHGQLVMRQQEQEKRRVMEWEQRVAVQALREEQKKRDEYGKLAELKQKKHDDDKRTVTEKKQEYDALVTKWNDRKKLEATLRKECEHAQQNLAFFNGTEGILRQVYILRQHTAFADGGNFAISSTKFYHDLLKAKTECCFPSKLPEINPLCTCSYCVAELSR